MSYTKMAARRACSQMRAASLLPICLRRSRVSHVSIIPRQEHYSNLMASSSSLSSSSCLEEHKSAAPKISQKVRSFSRSSDRDNACLSEAKATTFIIAVGYSPAIAKGIVKALKDSGLSGDMLLSSSRSMAGRWEVGEDEGLEALAASVQQHLAVEEGKSIITVHIVPPNAWNSAEQEDDDEQQQEHFVDSTRAFPVEALEGMSLTDVAKFGEHDGATTLGEYLECACAGIMACSTCHVVLPQEWFEKVGPASEAELDMIDLAYNPQPTSRLGCQIVLKKELDGLVVKLPKGSHNLMDFVPFE